MDQQTTITPADTAGLKFDDLLNFGVARYFDSEFGNPPAPGPDGGSTTADKVRVEGGPAGTVAGALGLTSNQLVIGGLVLVGAVGLYLAAR